ncbi:CheR family methyltransferase [Paraburkholderia phosphatilytica]|uniref:CheR family methyltransferase n=1 Tax=Paraburkholderia phosphatilytica TaxID=2282883 RepID=UPI000E4E48A2|nr:protein-glutamate O-methyltransferase CheR [Paraburkholderia phosphatilytica]
MSFDRDADQATRLALFEQVRRHTGIVMNERKWAMLEGRLRRRIRALELPGYRDYLQVLEAKPAEVTDFIDLVTTNETSFFRTPRVWDYFGTQFLPAWFAGNPQGTLRLWSAASSSGEEAYSAAMLCEEFRARHPSFRYRILGTDISEAIVRDACNAHFRGRSAEGLKQAHPHLLQKYFTPRDDGFTANGTLRANVSFRQHNLYASPRELGTHDLAFLRNVLIYFDADGQLAVLENVRRALVPQGVLIVGESESLSRFDTGFVFEQPLIYRNGHSNGATLG